MRRNKTLVYLAQVMENCNMQDLTCDCIFKHCSKCVNELADDAIGMVQRLMDKPEIKSCRIPLEIDFERMTDQDYWLRSNIFSVRPAERSEVLKQKIVKLVNMLSALQLKILQVDADYAEQVFKRMAARMRKSACIFKYELWRKCHPHHTIKQLEDQQVQLTADVLIAGIMAYDEAPTGDEIAEVQLELVRRGIKHGQQLPDNFVEECAKLKRYSYWKGEHLFMINYRLIYTYLFSHCFEKFTKKQRIALYEYDVQLRMIHDDMAKIKPELGKLLMEDSSVGGDLNMFAPAKCLKELLHREDVRKLVVDKRFSQQWIETFIDEFFKSEWGKVIAQEWTKADKRLTLQGSFMGCLKAAEIIEGSDMGIARAVMNGNERENKTFATYIGKWRDQPYFCWIDDYVKQRK